MSRLCDQFKELIADSFGGILTTEQSQDLENHLTDCSECRAYADDLQEEDRLLGRWIASLNQDMAKRKQLLLMRTGTNGPKQTEKNSMWSIIMKSRFAKISIAAVVMGAVLIVINPFEKASQNVAWGEVVENIINARTITWKVSSDNDLVRYEEYMVLEPDFMRIEYPDGRIRISDHHNERGLVLDPTQKTAILAYARKQSVNFYAYFQKMKDVDYFDPQVIVTQEVDGIELIGFKKTHPRKLNYGVKADNTPYVEMEETVWVDPATDRPVSLEQLRTTADGETGRLVFYDIAFDAELDAALFSLDIPPGYQVIENSAQFNFQKTAQHMNDILKHCAIYENQHEQWPDRLEDLELDYIDMSGYVYIKPSAQAQGGHLVLYEAYDVWQQGITVGFANFRIEFIETESEFVELLTAQTEDQ